MKKINKINLPVLFLLVQSLFIYKTEISFASEDNGKYILGKVIYADNKSPVTSGNISVIRKSGTNRAEELLEKAIIQSNGEFKIVNPVYQSSDNIKLMAYPNDLDNNQNQFEPKVLDLAVAKATNDKQHEIIIEVIRANIDKSKGSKIFQEENNLSLNQNFPNPFNPTTLIEFNLPNTSKVSLKIYNMKGENVATLIDNKNYLKGKNEVEFNAGRLPSGIYIYTLNANGFTENRKMILIK